MVTHIVIFTWIAEVTAEQVENLRQALNSLAVEFAETVTIKHGPDLRFRDINGSYALVATFPDRAGWDAYQADPRHKAVVRDFVLPIQASRLTVQF
ncbi:Stress responsive A/B Barrel Domain [Duganella sp. CF517]|uniref:Dabb family protein n=1 Tax=Duganella sp. CF517 TaxID=1881038 RepID=UPI0008C5E68A|nr:Dabb family protein [Duganella sp. CF517]SEO09601.1 Stress responsive A/B Barrel Domain [Duganella sp. CF517]